MAPLGLLPSIVGHKPELSEQMGNSQFTLTRSFNSSLTMSPGQKLHDGGSKSQVEKKKKDVIYSLITQDRSVHVHVMYSQSQ